MIRLYSQTIKAGERQPFPHDGNYVRLKSSAVAIEFETENGDAFIFEQGEEAVIEPFKTLFIKNPSGADQLITYYVGKGNVSVGSAKVGGIVSILGDVSLTAATLAALESVDLNSATRDLLRFETYGASYRSTTALAANTPETVFTAAANVNGAIIHSAQFADTNSSTTVSPQAEFLAKATAPVSVIDGDAILGADAYAVYSASLTMTLGSLKNPIKIPAGKGLYFITAVAQAISSRSVLYTLL